MYCEEDCMLLYVGVGVKDAWVKHVSYKLKRHVSARVEEIDYHGK